MHFPSLMDALHMKRAPLVLAILLALTAGAVADPGSEPRISRFSGKPVPRFETLRWAEVNGRTEPNLTSSIAWQYNRKGLPVMIVKESGEWYRIRDPAGDEVWMHKRMLEEANNAVVTRTGVITSDGSPQAERIAEIGKGVLVHVVRCEGALCEVEAAGYRGWISRANLWGAGIADTAQTATNG